MSRRRVRAAVLVLADVLLWGAVLVGTLVLAALLNAIGWPR